MKIWSAPHTKYVWTPPIQEVLHNFNFDEQVFLDQRYLGYGDGKELKWHNWFATWCDSRGLDVKKQFQKYKDSILKVNSLRDSCGIIHEGYQKFVSQVGESHIDDLLYFDIYQLWHFWKSALWSLAFYSKQSQSSNMIDILAKRVQSQLWCHLVNNQYDAVCFVPHSLKRSVQILDWLKKVRNLDLPEIYLQKLVPWDVIIPQKSIKWTKQRIRNARETIYVVPNQKPVEHILLIDDFVWSWATLNESAKKLIDAWLAKTVTWMAIVWNIDMSFDVISEV